MSGLESNCAYGLYGPLEIPISGQGPGTLPSTLTSTTTELTLAPGTYTIDTPDFLCGSRYTTWTSSRTVTVTAGESAYVALNYRVYASFMFGRVWYSRGWNIPLGFSPETVNFNQVQWRIQTSDGSGAYEPMGRDRWQRIKSSTGEYVEITSLVPSQPNLEFRLVDVDGMGRITRIYYPPYTCGVDACDRPTYNLLWSP